MQAKAFEVRDSMTFIALLAVDINTDEARGSAQRRAQARLLKRVGYPCNGQPNILITKLSGNGSKASNDPYYWGDRTFAVAHNYIIENWAHLPDGAVIDVEFILGETTAPKSSELT